MFFCSILASDTYHATTPDGDIEKTRKMGHGHKR